MVNSGRCRKRCSCNFSYSKAFWKDEDIRDDSSCKKLLCGGQGKKKPESSDDTLYLYAIGVLPEMQGKGIASKLIREKLAECSNQTVYLETNTEHNCRFYQKFGFEPVLKTFYKKNNLTTWYMVKYPKT